MNRVYNTVMIMCLVVMMFGCRNSKPQQPAFTGDGAKRNTSQSISSTASLQKEKTEEIKTAVVNIEKNVTESLKKTEEIIFESENILTITTDESIKPSINTIIEDAKDIDAEMVSITQEYEKIKTSTVSIEKYTESIQKDAVVVSKLQDQIAELQNKSKEAQQAAIKELYTTLSFFFGLGFLTIVAGVVIAFLVNRKLGYSIAGIGLFALALAAGAIYYMQAIAIVAISIIIGGIVVSLGVGIWLLIKENKEKVVLEQANQENVKLVQTIKEHLDDTAKVQIFGEVKPGLVETIQSDQTRQVVKKIKTKMKSEAPTNEKIQ